MMTPGYNIFSAPFTTIPPHLLQFLAEDTLCILLDSKKQN